jgi:hypothetical protein
MTLYESCSKICSNINDSNLFINATLISEINDEVNYELELFSNTLGYISMKFQIILNKTILTKNIERNGGKVIPNTENKDIQEFIIRRNVELFPYLEEYSNIETDYNKLATLYYDSRGTIIGKRFGF